MKIILDFRVITVVYDTSDIYYERLKNIYPSFNP